MICSWDWSHCSAGWEFGDGWWVFLPLVCAPCSPSLPWSLSIRPDLPTFTLLSWESRDAAHTTGQIGLGGMLHMSQRACAFPCRGLRWPNEWAPALCHIPGMSGFHVVPQRSQIFFSDTIKIIEGEGVIWGWFFSPAASSWTLVISSRGSAEPPRGTGGGVPFPCSAGPTVGSAWPASCLCWPGASS